VARLAILLGVGGAVATAFFWLNRYAYFSNLWTIGLDEGLVTYIIKIGAGPRYANAVAGYRVFELHPWFGAGLGGSSLYLFQHYPEWAKAGIFELARHFSPSHSTLIPNIRNLYLRLLAETGIVGFWAFIAFYLSLLGGVARLLRHQELPFRYIGTAGLFIWLAVAIRNLTQDSFAFPIMWVSLGIVVGYANLIRLNSEGD
jgi:O-antigen ligase